MESGDWNLAESILSSVFVSGPDGVRRKRALAERIDRHRKFLKRVDMAAAAYRDANWMDAVEQYYRLVSDGYALTEEDRARIGTSANNVRMGLNLKRHSVGRSGSDMTAEKVDQELRRLSDMMKTMKVDYEEDSEEP